MTLPTTMLPAAFFLPQTWHLIKAFQGPRGPLVAPQRRSGSAPRLEAMQAATLQAGDGPTHSTPQAGIDI